MDWSPNAKNKASKCHHIHIGKSNNYCPTLKAHNINIEKVEHDTYVGDEISNDVKFDKTIDKRYSKATGTTSEIMNILRDVCLGNHYFKTSIIFHNLKFINSVLTNAEVWHPINENTIKKLEEAEIVEDYLDEILPKLVLSIHDTNDKS